MRNTESLTVWIGALILASNFPLAAANLRIQDGRPIVDGVYVNGHGPYLFLLDTGTNVNLMDANLAQSIGLNSSFDVALGSSVGATQTAGTEGVEIALGLVRAVQQKILFSGLETIHRKFPDVQGVIGQFFLSRFDYLLDLRGKRLEFGKHSAKGTRIPIEWINGRPAVATNLGRIVLDSGSGQVILFGVQPTAGDQSLRTLTGSIKTGTADKSLWIGGRNFWRGNAVAVADRAQAEAGADGLLPMGLFKTAYFCNSGGFVVLD